MGVIKNRDIDPRLSARDGDGSLKDKAAIKKGIRQRDRIRMDGRNDVGPRSEILSMANVGGETAAETDRDRKSTRLNSSHPSISYAVFCLKKKKKKKKLRYER